MELQLGKRFRGKGERLKFAFLYPLPFTLFPFPLPYPDMASPKSGGNSQPYDYRRFLFTLLLFGQVWLHLVQGKTCWRKIPEHLFKTGPASIIPVLLVNVLAGMIFTIQTARQLEKFGAINSVGGAFAIAFCRELAPILTASVVTGQVGSAFAAEIGAMKVTEQIDALYTLRTDPIDYLILPRTIACACMMPILIVLGLVCGVLGGAFAAWMFYKLLPTIFLESVRTFLLPSDLVGLWLKGLIFGGAIGTIGCGWGMTTYGGVKQVGESATAAVVLSVIAVFMIDLFLSLLFGGLPINESK
jgi:phospholipid/cholesterol/gamma-HCH transport system permease protein